MNTSFEKLSSNKVKLSFVVEPEAFEKGIQIAYRKMVGRINIPGFRKGKAPRKVIEMHYGPSVFYEEAFDAIFPDLYKDAVKEHGIEPVDRPSLDVSKIGAGEALEFDVEVFVKPDVELGVYKGVEAHKHEIEVTEDDVNAQIERERERVSRFVDIDDRPVKLDDQINLDYSGSVDGVPFDGGTAENQTLVIGSDSFIPGFEQQLIGAELGQELDVNVVFPEDYHEESLSGQPATFRVKINSISEKEMPKLDDEFAKDVSEFETFEEYKADVRAKLDAQAKERSDAAFENSVIEAVVENAVVDIPEAMIEDQLDSMMRDMQMRMMYQGLRIEDYYRYMNTSEEQLRDSQRDAAEERVKTRLVLEAVMKAEGIEATEEDIEDEIKKFAEQGKRSVEDFKKTMQDSDREYFKGVAEFAKTVQMLKDNAVLCDHDHDHEHDDDHDHEDSLDAE